MTQTQPDPLKQKSHNPTQPTNRLKLTQLAGWVGLGQFLVGWWVGCTPLDVLINHKLSQKLNLTKNEEFNHLTIILTPTVCPNSSLISRAQYMAF